MADVGFVTNIGLQLYNSALSTATDAPKYIAWGTGGSAVATAINTALTTEEDPARCTGTVTLVTSSSTCDTFQVTGTLTATAALTIDEVGLFTTSSHSAGYCLARITHDSIALNSGDSIAYTIKVTLDQS